MSAVQDDVAIPQRIGKYDVLGIAGRGAMGVVYLGRDPVIDRKIAIKVCPLANDDSASAHLARKMFLNEARLAGSLDHPNVLRIHDAGEIDGDAFIIMEYVEGAKTLQAHGSPGTLLPVAQVVEYGRQCAEALAYAHANGVVHRDVKPANIMLTGTGIVKLVDFGIAQRQDPDRTQLMGSYGSPRYMSPEQALDETVGPATDLYSLAATLFELLTGRAVFEAKSLVVLLRSIIEEPPPGLRALRPDLPESLERVLAKALAKEPAQRHESGTAMAADLARVLAELEQPVETPLDETTQLLTLKGMRFFAGFPEPSLREVLRAGVWESHAPGTAIVRAGENDHALYLLTNGQVSVRKGEVAICTLDAGECFGEMGFLERGERSATVVAVNRVSVLKVAADIAKWASLPCQMRFGRAFQRTLVRRLCSASERLARPVA